MSDYIHFPGLDYDFLRYMGVEPETQRRIQSHYLPTFAGCKRVLDLGCGDGDFLALLAARGIEAVGVDFDEKTLQAALTRGLPVVQADVFDYLADAPAGSFDGIFCAHLVEHLPYHLVIKLVQEAQRVLQPGGVIVLATPNARSIFAHLEMFYMHFGHISFYHPRLLCFFLEHAGFVDAREGVNPETASPMLPGVMAREAAPPDALRARLDALMHYRRQIPVQGNGLVARLSHRVKNSLARWLVQPLLDDVAARTHGALGLLAAEVTTQNRELASINGPFECYAVARKALR
ncbi:MAG: class I SAM-dependent methyltransferase [Caldilineaceae bacterium]